MSEAADDPGKPGLGPRLEEGAGWNKPVSPPKAEMRPPGLPPKPAPSSAETSNDKKD